MIDNYAADFGDKELGHFVFIEHPLKVTRVYNENFMGVFTGKPGRGKTWAAVRLAEQLDDTFDVSRVCVTYKEFVDKLNELAEMHKQGYDIAGRVVVFDEFQKSASARRFMSSINQAINDVLHTFRYLNLIVFFTTPHISFIDVNARAVMHFHVTMMEKRVNLGLTRGKIRFTEIKDNILTPNDKMYTYSPRVYTNNGVFRVSDVWFEKPSKKLRMLVDEKINSFKRAVIEESKEEKVVKPVETKESKAKQRAEKLREWAHEIFKNRVRYYDSHRKRWDEGAVLLDYPELTPTTFKTIRSMLNAMLERVG